MREHQRIFAAEEFSAEAFPAKRRAQPYIL